MGLQLGLDTGGTYTDAVLVDDALDVVRCAKSLTTHRDLIGGLRGAVEQVVTGDEAGQIELACLSTTLATNALVEGRGRFAQEQWSADISSGQRPHEQRAQRVGSHDQ